MNWSINLIALYVRIHAAYRRIRGTQILTNEEQETKVKLMKNENEKLENNTRSGNCARSTGDINDRTNNAGGR